MNLLPFSVAALGLIGSCAFAQYTVTLEVNNGLPPFSETQATGFTSSLDNPLTYDNGATSQSAVSARAFAGTVGAEAVAEVATLGKSMSIASARGSATATARTTQLVMTSGSSSVNTPLALDFSGFTSGVFTLGSFAFSGGGNAGVSLSVLVKSADGSTTYYSGTGEYSSGWNGNGEASTPIASGLLSGFTGAPSTITTGSFNVPSNVPLQLELSLTALANVSAYTGLNATLTSSFGHTLSLTTSGPVFPGLLSGESANALDFNLAGNVFTPVPEPGTWALLAGTLVAAVALLRRRG